MAFNNFYLEPNLALSPMSVIYDFDLENRENCAPTYASLSNVQAFDTPPRSFGTVITNSIKVIFYYFDCLLSTLILISFLFYTEQWKTFYM